MSTKSKLPLVERARLVAFNWIAQAKLDLRHVILIGIIIGAPILIFDAMGGTHTPTDRDLSSMAYVQAKNYVKMVLKAPASADFPFMGQGEEIKENLYLVDSYVDSQNSFGAMLRSEYSISLEYQGGDPADQNSWKVIGFVLDGKNLTDDVMGEEDLYIKNCIGNGKSETECRNLYVAFIKK
jgi:hypothetical protein